MCGREGESECCVSVDRRCPIVATGILAIDDETDITCTRYRHRHITHITHSFDDQLGLYIERNSWSEEIGRIFHFDMGTLDDRFLDTRVCGIAIDDGIAIASRDDILLPCCRGCRSE